MKQIFLILFISLALISCDSKPKKGSIPESTPVGFKGVNIGDSFQTVATKLRKKGVCLGQISRFPRAWKNNWNDQGNGQLGAYADLYCPGLASFGVKKVANFHFKRMADLSKTKLDRIEIVLTREDWGEAKATWKKFSVELENLYGEKTNVPSKLAFERFNNSDSTEIFLAYKKNQVILKYEKHKVERVSGYSRRIVRYPVIKLFYADKRVSNILLAKQIAIKKKLSSNDF
jgi:hypothetical protein